MSSPDWMSAARCTGRDAALFFPADGDNANAAKAICRRCPVQAECLTFALDNREKSGIWGGLGDRQRRPLQRGHARPVRPIRHGAPGGARAHRRRGEQPCESCLEAQRRARRPVAA